LSESTTKRECLIELYETGPENVQQWADSSPYRRGIIFDVLECIIQRDLGYATTDVREEYAALVDILSKEHIHKVVLILHSQGGIEGGLVLDWLYDTLPATQLRKLEIYTFGNAANHWNAPIVSVSDSNGRVSVVKAGGSSTTGERLVRHIEHYANEGDYVSKFGILHFRPDQARPQTSPGINSYPSPPQPPSAGTSLLKNQKSATYPQSAPPKLKTSALTRTKTWTPSPKTPIERNDLQRAQENNRYFGRLFKRASSGHLLNMHYLDNMFEMEDTDPKDRSKGKVKEQNDFMDSEVDLEVFEQWDTVQAVGESQPTPSLSWSAGGGRSNGTVRKTVKELSRLWAYRNGASPEN
jgi:hypothetical protein